jgi:hypothetical protein
MRSSRLWSLMLVPGGVAAGHALGYSAAELAGSSPAVPGGHGYLDVLFRLAVPFTLVVLARAFLSGARHELPPVRFSRLAALQVALFAVVEIVEHGAAGIGPAQALGELSLVLGIAAQLLVAGALVRLVHWMRRAGELVAAARQAPRRRTAPVLRPSGTAVAVVPVVAVSSLSRRGPPPTLVR